MKILINYLIIAIMRNILAKLYYTAKRLRLLHHRNILNMMCMWKHIYWLDLSDRILCM